MRPLSSVLPKEMLPLGDKPMIRLAVEEAVAAGVREICVIIRNGKEIVRDYLLKRSGEIVGRGPRSCRLSFTYQKRLNGLGGALSAARGFVGRDPFLMIIPDQILLHNRASASRQLLARYRWNEPVVLSSMVKIPKKEAKYFAGARGFVARPDGMGKTRTFAITGVEAAGRTSDAFAGHPYEIRGFGRTVFPPTIFDYLTQRFANPNTREIDLWKTFKAFPNEILHYGCVLNGRACDLGTIAGYLHYLPLFF